MSRGRIIGIAVVAIPLLWAIAFGIGHWMASTQQTRSALSSCRQAIKDELLSPSSAKFRHGYISQPLLPGQKPYVNWTVSAKNAFGVRIERQFACPADKPWMLQR